MFLIDLLTAFHLVEDKSLIQAHLTEVRCYLLIKMAELSSEAGQAAFVMSKVNRVVIPTGSLGKTDLWSADKKAKL